MILPRSASPESSVRRRPVEWRIAPAVLLAGCSGPLSALDPAGPAADAVATLWWIMFWGAAVLFLAVGALYFAAYARPAALARFSTAQWIVGGGLVMPTVVLVGLVTSAFVLGERLIPRPLDSPPLRVSAQAQQWTWRFGYADGDALTRELHIPAGQPVDVVVTTADVIHSFWVPRLGGKIDAIPGHENVLRLEADRPGTYRGVCAEFCGTGHTDMPFTIVAHAPGDYQTALRQARTEAAR